ncbi:trypsin-like peptidase domain-containing protein [Leptolyngbya sp. FACHB-36]|uniref:S1C family serine protease n=1 Tax=Leptolyngbya sp. FACHB-36 TaxID=2692808 RepID=UPI00168161C4|nr:serine protease [Leptolyngbya sp. FACHB-36]MBD2021682.1 trypsin-like peptidase domain-containing protein [Leptolyngbya sp. FACHB-36]
MVVLACGAIASRNAFHSSLRTDAIPPRSPQSISTPSARSLEAPVQQVKPAVVTIDSNGEISAGSLITANGVILTSKHALNHAVVTVKTISGKTYSGRVTAIDLQHDLALVQLVTSDRFPTLRFATNALQPGQPVYAIGSPSGRSGTLTAGTFRRLTQHGSLQTSAGLLQPGNSGGPLLNAQGELVGVNKGLLDDGSGLATSVLTARKFVERNSRSFNPEGDR